MAYRAYDDETLQRLQSLELMILREFDLLCRENKIRYFGCGGTAIGAVRHGGFIPWDDDIDVGMLRRDYDRFLKAAARWKPDRFRVVNAETDADVPFPSTRWVLRGTRFQEECFRDLDCELGIFLDIYCFDNIPDDDRAMKRQAWAAWFYGKMMVLSGIDRPVLYFGGWKAEVVYLLCRIAHKVLKLCRLGPSFWYRKAKRVAVRYRHVKTKRAAFYFDPTPFTSIVYKKHIFPTREREFSGLTIPFPGKVQAYLKRRYGDYMTLPPEEKRHNHPPYRLDFGPYAQIPLEELVREPEEER